MDELDISGKRFISSKRAAKENKYHVDYIGQLIRGGKIIGSKVGRTWYVEAESLATYLGKEYAAPTQRVVAETFVPPQVDNAAPHIFRAYITPEEITQAITIKKDSEKKEDTSIEIKTHREPYQPFREVPQLQPVERVLNNTVEIKKEIFKDEPHVPFSALTYLSDDEPLVPARRPIHAEVPKPIERPIEHIAPQQKAIVRSKADSSVKIKPARHTGRVATTFALAAVGIVVFVVALGASYLLSYTSIIQGTQNTASVSLSK